MDEGVKTQNIEKNMKRPKKLSYKVQICLSSEQIGITAQPVFSYNTCT